MSLPALQLSAIVMPLMQHRLRLLSAEPAEPGCGQPQRLASTLIYQIASVVVLPACYRPHCTCLLLTCWPALRGNTSLPACPLELCSAWSDMHGMQPAAAAQCLQEGIDSRQMQWMLHLPAADVYLQALCSGNSLPARRLQLCSAHFDMHGWQPADVAHCPARSQKQQADAVGAAPVCCSCDVAGDQQQQQLTSLQALMMLSSI